MTWLYLVLLALSVLLFLAACVFVAVRLVRMANDRDHAVGMHDTSEIKDVPTPRQRGRRS